MLYPDIFSEGEKKKEKKKKKLKRKMLPKPHKL